MLRRANVPMAICSGSLRSEIETILKKASLLDYFQTIVSAQDIKKGKPDPEGFLLALKQLNDRSDEQIPPNRCVVIEDSHWGLEAALAANMPTIAVTNSYDADQLTAADIVVTRLDNLTIEDLNKLCD